MHTHLTFSDQQKFPYQKPKEQEYCSCQLSSSSRRAIAMSELIDLIPYLPTDCIECLNFRLSSEYKPISKISI